MIEDLYHPKQLKALKFALNNDFFMMIQSGAKRTGKTIVNNDIFLLELKRVREIADKLKIKKPQYILAGADLGALQRNVLLELENKYDIEFQFDKHNRFELFGVKVCCFGHSKTNDLGRIRGMTSFGAYINEGSIANQMVFNEIKSRCSGEGARVLVDTNPDNPNHWLKKDFIDKSDGKVIKTFHYRLDDNTFLSERYRENIKSSTSSGMFYDRDIEGLWVNADGIVYQDFSEDKYVDGVEGIQFKKYFAGVDWGYEHYGAIVVIGKTIDDEYYLLEEIAEQHQDIDYWVDRGKDIVEKYGNISFYCDTARPEYIKAFIKARLRAKKADKSVNAGIGKVGSLYKANKLYILNKVVRFKEEIYNYVWKPNSDEPIKVYDDVQDALRYAIYTESTNKGKLNVMDKGKLF